MPSIGAGQKRILVLEDDKSLEPVVKGALYAVAPDAEVEWVTAADHILETIQSGAAKCEHDLVIADIFLDGSATGFDLWREFHAACPRTAFLIISGMSFEEFRQKYATKGPAPLYLRKPFSPGDLMDVVRRLLK
jgi:DNA-binding NtrC family response regulator